MCCQIFFAAFHRLHPRLANEISLRVSGETLTGSRSIVDYVHDHWKQWVEEAQAAADHAALLAAANDPLPPTYPAYNHNLHTMPKERYQRHVQESFSKLHVHQNHHYYHDSIKVTEGPTPVHEEHQPGDCAPYDLGQASTWGSATGQTERCKTRSDDCVCKQCSITVPQQKQNTVASNRLIPGPEYICPSCGQQGDHYNYFCTVNRKAAQVIDNMLVDPQRAALMATGSNLADEPLPKQVPSTQLEAADTSSSDLIMFSSGSEAEEAQPTCFEDDGDKAFGN
ncbi:hypothetical protein TRIATDRAFT_320454, partial [Trichoderma atroviride IMI 206040]